MQNVKKKWLRKSKLKKAAIGKYNEDKNLAAKYREVYISSTQTFIDRKLSPIPQHTHALTPKKR